MNSYLAVMSTDAKFMCRLIDWLNTAKCDSGSTVIRQHDMDPYEELDLRMAQIEGMTERIRDLESDPAHTERMLFRNLLKAEIDRQTPEEKLNNPKYLGYMEIAARLR